MRSATLLLLGLTLAAIAGLAAAALLNERAQAFTLGVLASSVVEIEPGSRACQAPVTVPEHADFDAVAFAVGTNKRPGPRLDVSVHEGRTAAGAVLGSGTLPAGYPDVDREPRHTVRTGRVAAGSTVAVCFANRGPRSAFIYGDADAAARASQASVNGKPTGKDLALSFQRREPRSLAALLPAMIERVALFRAQWVGAWTYVLLALLVLLAVPALLVGALRAAARDMA